MAAVGKFVVAPSTALAPRSAKRIRPPRFVPLDSGLAPNISSPGTGLARRHLISWLTSPASSSWSKRLVGLRLWQHSRGMAVQAAFVPAGTPGPIIERLNQLIRTGQKSKTYQEFTARSGGEAAAGTPEDLAAFVRSETKKWANAVKLAGIKPERVLDDSVLMHWIRPVAYIENVSSLTGASST